MRAETWNNWRSAIRVADQYYEVFEYTDDCLRRGKPQWHMRPLLVGVAKHILHSRVPPQPAPCVTLHLNHAIDTTDKELGIPDSAAHVGILTNGINRIIKKEGIESLRGSLFVLDLSGSSQKRVRYKRDASLCLTSRRCSVRSYFLLGTAEGACYCRYMKQSEMCALRGFPKWFTWPVLMSQRQRGLMIANTMPVRILSTALSGLQMAMIRGISTPHPAGRGDRQCDVIDLC